ncbi:MAG: OmpA family protein [bacterium]|nr:OmpA family protein [bacterium]MDI1337667.1 OmpA family protein [Lacunisphaera sp.]
MKHVSKLLGLVLVAAALLLSACAKKPVRSATPDNTQTGPGNMIDPTQVAVGPDSTLEKRPEGTVPDANKSVVEPVYFALDRAAVAPAERPKLQAAIKWLADNPTKSLVMVGHCDWRGTAEYNLGLGDRRANSVKKFLESMGADGKRLETLSKGSTDAKQGGGEAEWQKDRRVDFVELVKQ